MPFNSLAFLVFFAVFYLLYVLLQRFHKLQNGLLLLASYFFYGFWDWRFAALLCLSTLVDFFISARMGEAQAAEQKRAAPRKAWLFASIVFNLALLGFFKYFGFFVDSLAGLFNLFGLQLDPASLNIILPVGISFYTFQKMGYMVDVYRGKLEPERNLLSYAVFVAYFPLLLSGPIERAANLLPQINRPRRFYPQQLAAGWYLILSGYVKKVVIADNLALVANAVFDGYTTYAGLDILLGVVAYTFQIYCDFSGYSDIARGLSRLMGFEIMVNFRLPYFALSPSDFWQRWHISLSTWLRDYLYISLGGNRKGELRTYFNLATTMILGGLWHGAAWTFVVWGAYHAFILILYRLFDRGSVYQQSGRHKHSYAGVFLRLLVMFTLTLGGWLIFRSTSLDQVWYMLTHVSLLPSTESAVFVRDLAFFITPLLLVQLYQAVSGDLLILTRLRTPLRVLLYASGIIWIILFGVRESTEFIYFQF